MLIKVVFPNPDSPATIIVKAAPRFATILWRWLGRLWIVSSVHIGQPKRKGDTDFAMPMGDALSVVGGAIFCDFFVALGGQNWEVDSLWVS